MILRILLAVAALLAASPAIAQIDPAARGMAAQASQTATAASAQASTLSRLRAASVAARSNNVLINPPLLLPAAWATSTAVFQGEVRSSNGNWYVAVTSGTTGSNASSTWRISIDNLDGRGPRLISPSGLRLSQPYITINNGTAKPRLYTIYLSPQGYDGVLGVEVGGQSQVWSPSRSGDLRAIVISDSTVQGSGQGPWLAGGDVASRLAALTGIADVWSFSAGGTGEINPSANGWYTFGQRIPEALALKPDVWIIMGSVNDRTYSAASISAAVQATMTAIRAGGSRAPIIRVGAWPIANDATITTDEVAIKAGYDSFAASDPYPHAWVPWSTGSPPVITWPYNTPSAAPGGNNQRYLGGDGHPTDIGTAHEARRLAEATLAVLVP